MTGLVEPRVCSIARTLEVVGEKWALLAVREVFLGNRRFDQMIRRTGAPRDTLTARLRALVAAGILQRRQYSDHPQRFEYDLTAAGRELYPVILTLLRWGDEHLAGPVSGTRRPGPAPETRAVRRTSGTPHCRIVAEAPGGRADPRPPRSRVDMRRRAERARRSGGDAEHRRPAPHPSVARLPSAGC